MSDESREPSLLHTRESEKTTADHSGKVEETSQLSEYEQKLSDGEFSQGTMKNEKNSKPRWQRFREWLTVRNFIGKVLPVGLTIGGFVLPPLFIAAIALCAADYAYSQYEAYEKGASIPKLVAKVALAFIVGAGVAYLTVGMGGPIVNLLADSAKIFSPLVIQVLAGAAVGLLNAMGFDKPIGRFVDNIGNKINAIFKRPLSSSSQTEEEQNNTKRQDLSPEGKRPELKNAQGKQRGRSPTVGEDEMPSRLAAREQDNLSLTPVTEEVTLHEALKESQQTEITVPHTPPSTPVVKPQAPEEKSQAATPLKEGVLLKLEKTSSEKPLAQSQQLARGSQNLDDEADKLLTGQIAQIAPKPPEKAVEAAKQQQTANKESAEPEKARQASTKHGLGLLAAKLGLSKANKQGSGKGTPSAAANEATTDDSRNSYVS